MRIGIDGTFLQSETCYTGMGVYARALVAALVNTNGGDREELLSTIDLIALGYGARPTDLPPAVAWQPLTPAPGGRLSPWLSHQTVLPAAARWLELDLLHIPGVNLRLSQTGLPAWLPCPLVVTLHDAIPLVYYGRQGPPLPWRLRLGYRLAMMTLRRAAAIITVSETSRRDILATLPLRPERLTVVLNGLTPPVALSPTEVERVLERLGIDRPYLLYAGSFEPRKNLLGTVMAYRQALAGGPLPPLVLLVERESGHRSATMAAIAQSGIADRLHFLDSLTDHELAALYRAADLLLSPSLYEGFGFVPLQGLACGRPVIAGAAGALPEVLGTAARLVDPTDTAALSAAIREIVDQPALAAQRAAGGPAQAARFTWAAAAAQTLTIYRQIAGAANRQPGFFHPARSGARQRRHTPDRVRSAADHGEGAA